MYFESIIKDEFPDFYSDELKTFEETDEKIQNEASWSSERAGDAWNLDKY